MWQHPSRCPPGRDRKAGWTGRSRWVNGFYGDTMNVLITGGTKGIGRDIAMDFARAGCTLFLNYRSDDRAAEKAVAAMEAAGGKAHAIKRDLGSHTDCESLMAAVADKTDRLDVLIHGAVYAKSGAAIDLAPADLRQAVEVNASALLYLSQAARHLLAGGGSIIYISSMGSLKCVPKYAALGVTKAMGEALVRYLAVELGPEGIRVNTISSGPVDTESFRKVFGGGAADRLRNAEAATPNGRNVTGDDLARAVRFLVSDDASMIQGQRLQIDGGLFLL